MVEAGVRENLDFPSTFPKNILDVVKRTVPAMGVDASTPLRELLDSAAFKEFTEDFFERFLG